jgi:hypothetical protein
MKRTNLKRLLTTLSVLSLFSSFTSFAQTSTSTTSTVIPAPENTSTVDNSALLEQAKKSPFGLRVETQTVNTRDNNNLNRNDRYDNLADVYLSYSATTNNVFYVYPRFLYTKNTTCNKDYTLKEYQVAVRFDKLNILDEKAGAPINFTTSTRVYNYLSKEARVRNKNLGYFRQDLAFNKKFSDKFSILSDNRFSFYAHDKRYSTNTSLKYFHDLFFIPQYTFNDKYSAFLELWHRSKARNDGGDESSYDTLQAKAELDYTVSDSLVLGTALINQPFISHDNRTYQPYEYQYEINAVYSPIKDVKIIAIVDLPIITEKEPGFSAKRSLNRPSGELDLILTAF